MLKWRVILNNKNEVGSKTLVMGRKLFNDRVDSIWREHLLSVHYVYTDLLTTRQFFDTINGALNRVEYD